MQTTSANHSKEPQGPAAMIRLRDVAPEKKPTPRADIGARTTRTLLLIIPAKTSASATA